MLIQNLQQFDVLRRQEAEEIVAQQSGFTRQSFGRAALENDASIAVIATRNEEHDLPATLVTLAQSERPILPIIVDLPKSDRTAEFAKKMGAHVLITSNRGKFGALQLGIECADLEYGTRCVLLTDADTLVQPGWAGEMHNQAIDNDHGDGAAIFGSTVFRHGKSRLTDALRSVRFILKTAQSARTGAEPLITGQNMALNFSNNNDAWSRFMSVNPEIFTGDDMCIHDVFRDSGAAIIAYLSLGSLVISRGDRFSSIRELLAEHRERWVNKQQFYEAQYGDVTAYNELR